VLVGKKKINVKMNKSDRAHCKNENMEFYIIFVSSPICMIGVFGRGKHFQLCV